MTLSLSTRDPLGEELPCPVGCYSASLASLHQRLGTPPPPPNLQQLKTSPDIFTKCTGEHNHPWLRNTGTEGWEGAATQIMFLNLVLQIFTEHQLWAGLGASTEFKGEGRAAPGLELQVYPDCFRFTANTTDKSIKKSFWRLECGYVSWLFFTRTLIFQIISK